MTVKTLLMSNQTAMVILVMCERERGMRSRYTVMVCLSAVLLPKIRL